MKIGKKNTKSGLHIDSIGSFWQLLLNGSKKADEIASKKMKEIKELVGF